MDRTEQKTILIIETNKALQALYEVALERKYARGVLSVY